MGRAGIDGVVLWGAVHSGWATLVFKLTMGYPHNKYHKPIDKERSMSNVFVNEYGHELVTIQLTLSKDDVAFMQDVIETGEIGSGILEHIVEQYNAVKGEA